MTFWHETEKKVKAITILTALLTVVSLMLTPMLAAFADNPVSRPNIKIRAGTSANWSGYAAESNILLPQNGFVKSVSGSWVVPALTCGSTNTYVATWVGIDGYSDGTVEQTGTEQQCINGVQQNYAWYEMYPKPGYMITTISVHPGDKFTASVTYIGNKNFVLSISNISTGQSFTHAFKSNGLRQSAEWIAEAPSSGGILPLANFGTITFTGAQFTDSSGTHAIDVHGLGTYDAITMNDPNGGNSTPSGLTDSVSASSFSVAYSP